MNINLDMYRNNNKPNFYVDSEVVTTTGTTDSIVTLAQAKQYLRVTSSAEDTLIQAMVINAIAHAEKYLNSDILSRTRRQYVNYADEPFNLLYAPIASIQSVSVDGTALTTEEYETQGLKNPMVYLNEMPSEKVLVNYTTDGITDESVRQGILCLIAWLYHGREAMMNTNWKSFLSPFKIFGYYGQK